MVLQVECQRCNAIHSFDDMHLGRRFHCKECRQPGVVAHAMRRPSDEELLAALDEAAAQFGPPTVTTLPKAPSLPTMETSSRDKSSGALSDEEFEKTWGRVRFGLSVAHLAGMISCGAIVWLVTIILGTLGVELVEWICRLPHSPLPGRPQFDAANDAAVVVRPFVLMGAAVFLGALLKVIHFANDELLMPAVTLIAIAIIGGILIVGTRGSAAIPLLGLAPLAQTGAIVLFAVGGAMCLFVPNGLARKYAVVGVVFLATATSAAIVCAMAGVMSDGQGVLFGVIGWIAFLLLTVAHIAAALFMSELGVKFRQDKLRDEMLLYVLTHTGLLLLMIFLIFVPLSRHFGWPAASVIALAASFTVGFGCNFPFVRQLAAARDAIHPTHLRLSKRDAWKGI